MLAQSRLPPAGCLVIDFRLPDMNGLDLLGALRRSGETLPAILITTNITPAPPMSERTIFCTPIERAIFK